jgi:hypothetical protein
MLLRVPGSSKLRGFVDALAGLDGVDVATNLRAGIDVTVAVDITGLGDY